MSSANRGRKRKQNKKSTRPSRQQPALLIPPEEPDPCRCAACAGDNFDPQEMIDDLTSSAAVLVKTDDPLDAELVGATVLAIGRATPAGQFEEALVDELIPQFEAEPSAEAMAMLLAIGGVAEGRTGQAARAAADRLAAAGITRPAWAAELDEPVTASDCVHLRDADETGSLLAGSFHRAGRSHAIVISVDEMDCGAADDITVLLPEHVPQALAVMRTAAEASNVEIVEEALDPAEFRWHVENALDARAVHDNEGSDLDADDLIDENGPGYPVLAALAVARMKALPESGRPKPTHAGNVIGGKPMQAALADLMQITGGDRAQVAPVPRRQPGQPAPVYRLKVSLRGAKPPIWRRLEVPADIRLDQLHEVIQVAFDWSDSHLHMFETPYGSFGMDDAELDQSPEESVTLEQVAPAEKSKLRYTYDFGDDWEHEILVEKVLDRDETMSYPRCTGGRRAAPPDDCGGVGGYAYLMEVLGDPGHPEHEDRLEWLGLEDAGDFDPAEFEAAEVTEELSDLR